MKALYLPYIVLAIIGILFFTFQNNSVGNFVIGAAVGHYFGVIVGAFLEEKRVQKKQQKEWSKQTF